MCSHNECLFDVGRLGRTGHKAPEFSGMFVGYTLVSIVHGINLILGGRQAIDGDTAQVGPQIAEKLGLPQVTYVEDSKSF